jgi:phosphatidylglycerol---prolipoprotein diacylglyceryl transferase
MVFPDISPVLIQIGPIAIRWYGLAYIAGILIGFRLVSKDLFRLGLNSDDRYNLMTWLIFGIFLGGRMGYVFFYDMFYYAQNPAQILAVWHGGMSYHGAAIGCMVALYLFGKRRRVSYLSLLDLLGFASTIGIFFGRLANFINAELYGRVTTMPWGVVFPSGGPLPRHPSQLYEAFGEGLFIFVVLWAIQKYREKLNRPLKPGMLFSYYLLLYGSVRFVIEFFREPDSQIGYVLGMFTVGQLLCLSMVLLGAGVFAYSRSLPGHPKDGTLNARNRKGE